MTPTPAPEGWEPGERTYPYVDANIESTVYAHHGDWLVSVSRMAFNDRVLLTHREQYPRLWTAGFCYDRGPAAGLAAAVWNPTIEAYPAGFKRIAADSRLSTDLPASAPAEATPEQENPR